jgi:hypothetical protein
MRVALLKVPHVGSVTRNKYSMSVGSLDLYTLTDFVDIILRHTFSVWVALVEIRHVGRFTGLAYSMSVALLQILHVGTVSRNKYSTWVGSLDLYSMSVALPKNTPRRYRV